MPEVLGLKFEYVVCRVLCGIEAWKMGKNGAAPRPDFK